MTNVLKNSGSDKKTDQLMKIYGLQSIDGGSAESLNFRNYPEFDDGDLYKSSIRQPSPSAMAPTTTIETVTVTRPLKVIAFIFGLLVMILMIIALTSTDWILYSQSRQGLFVFCVSDDNETLPALPFKVQRVQGCVESRDAFYIRASAILCVITFITISIGTLVTGIGLKSEDASMKYKFYRIAVLIKVISLVSLVSALIIYPLCFKSDIDADLNDFEYEFGWAYVVAWTAAGFLFAALVLLLCDKESEEIFYKERKIIHENGTE